MFCAKCGNEINNHAEFCPVCGNVISTKASVKFVLDPTEIVEAKPVTESSKSFSSMVKPLGYAFIILAILGDLIALFAIGFDIFIPVTIGATVLFVLGLFLTIIG